MWKSTLFLAGGFMLSACSEDSSENEKVGGGDIREESGAGVLVIEEADLGFLDLSGDQKLIGPLADAYRRLNPAEDGWETEIFSENVASQLNLLAGELKKIGVLEGFSDKSIGTLGALVTSDFQSGMLRPRVNEVFKSEGLRVNRFDSSLTPLTGVKGEVNRGQDSFVFVLEQLLEEGGLGAITHAKFKVSHVEVTDERVSTRVLVQLDGPSASPSGITQVNTTWNCSWNSKDADQPLLSSVQVLAYEEVIKDGKTLFSEMTNAVVGGLDSFRKQFAYGVDHWRLRIPAHLGVAVTGHHGLAVGDVNGDGLEDVYLCAEAGLPNRLLIQEKNGQFRDATKQSGADWLDTSASALILDLDNDGDQDLVVGLAWFVVLMENDGSGRFTERSISESKGQILSMAAADYDQDGDLDIFTCGYQGDGKDLRQGALAMPIPFHDANNGGANTLLRNQGGWKFEDQTERSGLGENNQRFSFSAVWEDYDNDGDSDLYVANDFGRNNLYQNNNGIFTDVAALAGAEDKAAGMSVAWSDVNQDGYMDLYISNMFSNAGNRVTYQNQFKIGDQPGDTADFQRFARGNTMFQNLGNGQFVDISEPAGVTMARWAWGSVFADFNNDSLDDIIVANGFITSTDSGDL